MPSDASLHLVDPRACLCPSLGRCLTASCSSAPLSFLSPLCRAIPSPPEEAHKHERSHAPQRRHPPQVVDLSSLDGGPRGVWAHWAPWEKGGASTKRRGWMGGWMSFLARGVWSCVRAFPLLGPFWVVVGISDGRGHSLTGAWAESGACFALPGPRLQDPAGPAAEISRCADGGEECVAARANVFPLLCSDDATISPPPPPLLRTYACLALPRKHDALVGPVVLGQLIDLVVGPVPGVATDEPVEALLVRASAVVRLNCCKSLIHRMAHGSFCSSLPCCCKGRRQTLAFVTLQQREMRPGFVRGQPVAPPEASLEFIPRPYRLAPSCLAGKTLFSHPRASIECRPDLCILDKLESLRPATG